jgi:hypothetical protein
MSRRHRLTKLPLIESSFTARTQASPLLAISTPAIPRLCAAPSPSAGSSRSPSRNPEHSCGTAARARPGWGSVLYTRRRLPLHRGAFTGTSIGALALHNTAPTAFTSRERINEPREKELPWTVHMPLNPPTSLPSCPPTHHHHRPSRRTSHNKRVRTHINGHSHPRIPTSPRTPRALPHCPLPLTIKASFKSILRNSFAPSHSANAPFPTTQIPRSTCPPSLRCHHREHSPLRARQPALHITRNP